MAYPRRRRYTAARARTGYRTRASSRYTRRAPVRRRRSVARRRAASPRTIRLVIQTVAASPLAIGMKGAQPVRRMF